MNEIANFLDGDLSHEANSIANTATNKSKRISFTQRIKGLFPKLKKIEDTNRSEASDTQNVLSVNNPPYAINNAGNESPLFTRTSPMDAFHHTGITEYDAHNLYGHMEALMTYRALRTIHPEKRPFILSRS